MNKIYERKREEKAYSPKTHIDKERERED